MRCQTTLSSFGTFGLELCEREEVYHNNTKPKRNKPSPTERKFSDRGKNERNQRTPFGTFYTPKSSVHTGGENSEGKEKYSGDFRGQWVVAVSCSGKACRTPEGGMPGGDCGVTCEWRKRVRSQLASFTTTDRMYHRYSCLSIPFLAAAHSCRIVTAKERENLCSVQQAKQTYKGGVSSLLMQSRFKLKATLFHTPYK